MVCLRVESQVDRIVKEGFGMLAFISQGIVYRGWDVILQYTEVGEAAPGLLFSFGHPTGALCNPASSVACFLGIQDVEGISLR